MRSDGTLVVSPFVRQQSSLVTLGETTMTWREDYIQLARWLVRATSELVERTGVETPTLDFEYKKIVSEGLVVKQVRQIPQASTTPSVTPFLLNEPRKLKVFQGGSNVFSNHRGKSTWKLETRNMWLTTENLSEGLYTNAQVNLTDGCFVSDISGPMASFPGYAHSYDGTTVKDSWQLTGHSRSRTQRLETTGVPTLVAPTESPIITQLDFSDPRLVLEHEEPVLIGDRRLEKVTTKTESVRLVPPYEENPTDLLIEQCFVDGKVVIDTAYIWSRAFVMTYPLTRWIETRISGLTTEPIVLHGEFSQSYWAGRHNWSESFVFAPRLEPGISPQILAELDAAGIHAILVLRGIETGSEIILYSEDDLGHACNCVPTRRGDLNGDGGMDVSDGVYLLLFLFAGGEAPRVPEGTSDLNGDQRLDVSDVIFLLQYLFGSGATPPMDCL